MKNRRRTPQQIVRKLTEADRRLSEGQKLPEVVKLLEGRYRGMKADDVQRLKELEIENASLKRIVPIRRSRSPP